MTARASEAHALCLTRDVVATGCVDDAEGYYREGSAPAELHGMRPRVADNRLLADHRPLH